ncbi:hypothetical protein F0231_09525 [Vibrio sp. RE86]|uniref:Ig-like domain-containing protein n=1 Tax=Vibrio sp. RE86 TaxID=2607605 RepID=UPI00149390BF|nr:Ig-like domain-containing protein [Vibrio sp. RE86]NOH79980.1 hypothetical protein [Vibrio sp. RE86]
MFAVAATLTLFGCGGEGSEKSVESSASGSPSSQSATLSAEDATYSTGYAESFEVDLSSKVLSSTGGGFTLSEVEVLSNNDSCQLESMTATGFVILASDTKVCDYRYHVTPTTLAPMSRTAEASAPMDNNGDSGASSEAIARVAVSSAPNETELTPVSATTFVDESASVSLKAELDNVGFTLGDEFVLTDVTLPFGRASVADVNPTDDQVIDYTPPAGFTGIDRILYTLEDSANGLVLMGVLDMAVGHEANYGFSIQANPEYADWVEVNDQVDIDISDYVVSEDGDDYQVVYADVFDASASVKDPTDVSNKTIVFSAAESGTYDISYAVSDHNGTYDMGSVRVRVFDQIEVWDEIYYNLSTFSSPLTVVEADALGTPYDDSSLLETPYTMALMTLAQGTNACSAMGGILPSETTLLDSRFSSRVVDEDWPTGHGYMTSEGSSVDVLSGGFTGYNTGYVTCEFLPASKDFQVVSSTNSATANDSDPIEVEVLVSDSDGFAVSDEPVDVTSSSKNINFVDQVVYTDDQGRASFSGTSSVAEEMTLTLNYRDSTETVDVEFIPDATTAKVTIVDDDSVYAVVDNAPILTAVVDDFGNAVTFENVAFSTSDSISFTENNVSVNADGEADNAVQFTGSGITELTETEYSVMLDNGDSQTGTITWAPSEDLPVTDHQFWVNKESNGGAEGSADYRFTSEGILITKSFSPMYALYDKAYTEGTFLLKAEITSVAANDNGSFAIYLQQSHDGSGIDSVPLTGASDSAIISDKGTGIVVSYYNADSLKVYQDGAQVGTVFNNPPLSSTKTYLWFEKINNQVEISINTVDVKPSVPFASVSAQFGNGVPYWLAISSVTNTTTHDRYFENIRISAY